MLFRRLFLCALFVGLLTGLFDSVVQRWQVVPLILVAEVFEDSAATAMVEHVHAEDAAHSHAAQAWLPQDGLERTAYTVLANVLNAMGSALLLMPLLAFWNRHRVGQPLALNKGYGTAVRYGLAWGAAGWLCLFALPALGQAPELPGMQAAELQARQIWWSLTVACGAGGLAVLCLVKARWRLLGLALLVLPFVIGAPQHAGSPFAGMSADVALQMQQLHAQFVVASAVASALQWLLLGILSALAVARWLSPLLNPVAAATRLEGNAS